MATNRGYATLIRVDGGEWETRGRNQDPADAEALATEARKALESNARRVETRVDDETGVAITTEHVMAAVAAWDTANTGKDPSDVDFGPCIACGEYNSIGGNLCMDCAEFYERAMRL